MDTVVEKPVIRPFAKLLAALIGLWSSRKLWMTIFGICILYGIYWHSVYWLRTLPFEYVAAYESMYQTMMYGVVTIVVGYTGFSALQGFTRNASSTALNVAQNLFSKSEEKIDIDMTYKEELERGD